MTPLAHAIAGEMTKRLSDRRIEDAAGIARRIADFHFFDCAPVEAVISEMLPRVREIASGIAFFLPAPSTWIEFAPAAGRGRYAVILEEVASGDVHLNIASAGDGGCVAVIGPHNAVIWADEAQLVRVRPDLPDAIKEFYAQLASRAVLALALINTPRIIGRRQHMPHAGLQRKIAAAKGMAGKFPLQGWTEIVLEVTPPVIDGTEHEGRLSGGKALHFCRQHLRIRNGRLERVSAHWRGDPSLGLKRTRYTVVPPVRSA